MKSSRLRAADGVAPDRALLGSIRRSLAAELGIQDIPVDRDEPPTEALNGLMQRLSAAIYEIGADGVITAYNDAAAALWGWRPEIGSAFWCGAARLLSSAGELVVPENSPAAIALATGEPAGAELVVERPDGLAVPITMLAMPRRDARGMMVGAIVTLVEVAEHAAPDYELYRMAAEASNDVIWDHDLVAGKVEWNQALQSRFGYDPDPEQSSFTWWLDRIHPEDAERIRAHSATARTGQQVSLSAEYRFRRADGSYADVLGRGWILRDAEGLPTRMVGALIDLSERKAAQQALRISEERLRLATDAARLGVADYDLVTGEVHWSARLREMLGIAPDAAPNWDSVAALLQPGDIDLAQHRHFDALRGDLPRTTAVYQITRPTDGAERWMKTESAQIFNERDEAVRLIVGVTDVTVEKTAQDRINWIANHDAVTGLPNRSAFQSELQAALRGASARDEQLALFLIDLDNFKYVNDTLGHQAGDAALAVLATRIREVVPAGAIAARIGGDEFAVILPDASTDILAEVAGRIMDGVQRPFTIARRSADLRASIGISVFPTHGESASDLIQNADMALYSAKAAGRANFKLFESSLRSGLQRQVSMLSEARNAIERGWIEPHYQPKVMLASGRIFGFEALLRWRHPLAGLQTPATIAAAFDDGELARLIGEAMTDAVLADLRGWRDQGIDIGKVAINASPAEFREPGFAKRLLMQLTTYDIAAAMVEIEITETALLSDRSDIVLAELQSLRQAGVSVALDDFGTGFSSLSHLRRLPVDTIKIDQAFVAGIGAMMGDCDIIDAVLRLGDAFGLATVAEGIETRTQAEFLAGLGCPMGQGFFYSAAVTAQAVPGMILGEQFGALASGPIGDSGGARWRNVLVEAGRRTAG